MRQRCGQKMARRDGTNGRTFEWVRVFGQRAFPDTVRSRKTARQRVHSARCVRCRSNEAQRSGRLTALAVIAALKVALGDLDRISAWTMVNGFVNADPGYAKTTFMLNPFSDLILDVFMRSAPTPERRSAWPLFL